MQQESPPTPREQHFHVSIAQHLFHHPTHGIVSVADAISRKAAEQYGLSPLLLYVLSVPDTHLHWKTFSPADRPLPLQQVLQQAWTTADGLRGNPDILCLSPSLALSCPELPARLARLGVEVRTTDSGDKAHAAFLRTAQQQSRWTLGGYNNIATSLEESVPALCRAAHRELEIRVLLGVESLSRRGLRKRTEEWLSLPKRQCDIEAEVELDWTAGPWLTDWEHSLPPEPPRYFRSLAEAGQTHLLTGLHAAQETEDEGYDGDDDHYWDSGHAYSKTPELVKHLVNSWPNTQLEISKHVGVSRRELDWYTRDKAGLNRRVIFHLEDVFNLEFDEFTGDYQALGPFVLVASNTTSIKYLFDEVSQGGDAQPFEVVPREGELDPLWRYVLIKRGMWPVCIIMAARGSQLVEQLPALVVNYQGVRGVDPALYRDVVLTCGRASKSPRDNVREMKEFQVRYRERWSIWV